MVPSPNGSNIPHPLCTITSSEATVQSSSNNNSTNGRSGCFEAVEASESILPGDLSIKLAECRSPTNKQKDGVVEEGRLNSYFPLFPGCTKEYEDVPSFPEADSVDGPIPQSYNQQPSISNIQQVVCGQPWPDFVPDIQQHVSKVQRWGRTGYTRDRIRRGSAADISEELISADGALEEGADCGPCIYKSKGGVQTCHIFSELSPFCVPRSAWASKISRSGGNYPCSQHVSTSSQSHESINHLTVSSTCDASMARSAEHLIGDAFKCKRVANSQTEALPGRKNASLHSQSNDANLYYSTCAAAPSAAVASILDLPASSASGVAEPVQLSVVPQPTATSPAPFSEETQLAAKQDGSTEQVEESFTQTSPAPLLESRLLENALESGHREGYTQVYSSLSSGYFDSLNYSTTSYGSNQGIQKPGEEEISKSATAACLPLFSSPQVSCAIEVVPWADFDGSEVPVNYSCNTKANCNGTAVTNLCRRNQVAWRMYLRACVNGIVLSGSGKLRLVDGENELGFDLAEGTIFCLPPLTPHLFIATMPESPLTLFLSNSPPLPVHHLQQYLFNSSSDVRKNISAAQQQDKQLFSYAQSTQVTLRRQSTADVWPDEVEPSSFPTA